MCGVKTFQIFFLNKINNIRNSKSVVKSEIVTNTKDVYIYVLANTHDKYAI